MDSLVDSYKEFFVWFKKEDKGNEGDNKDEDKSDDNFEVNEEEKEEEYEDGGFDKRELNYLDDHDNFVFSHAFMQFPHAGFH